MQRTFVRPCGTRRLDEAHGQCERGRPFATRAPYPTARSFPDSVADLDRRRGWCDASSCQARRDLPAMVEQCRDPEMIRWTDGAEPDGGYQLRDAEEFLA